MKEFALRRVCLVLLAVAVLAGCWLVPLDRAARDQVGDGLQRALTAFAAARALGAVISVAQGTHIDLKPAGVGVGFAPGQVLQPLNELVDRFAAVMLAASVAFGIQLLLLNIGAHELVSAGVSAAVMVWLVLRWRDRGEKTARWLRPVLVALLLVRFAVPLAGLASEAVYRGFMANEYRSAMTTIEKSPAAVIGRTPEPPGAEKNMLERIREWAQELPDLKAGYEAILKAASDWTAKIVSLIALFIVQTALLPLAFLWAAWRLVQVAVGARDAPRAR